MQMVIKIKIEINCEEVDAQQSSDWLGTGQIVMDFLDGNIVLC